MGAGQGVDAVHLHEIKVVDDQLQVRAFAGTTAGPKQHMTIQKDAAGGLIVDCGAHEGLSMV